MPWSRTTPSSKPPPPLMPTPWASSSRCSRRPTTITRRRTTRTTGWPRARRCIPRLVAAWDAFAAADQKLRAEVEAINDKRAVEKLAEIEKSEGSKARYHVQALMIQAKRVLRARGRRQTRRRRDRAGAEGLRRPRQGRREVFRQRAMDKSKIGSMFIEHRQVVPDHGQAADAPHPRSQALQLRRQDDARRRLGLDGRGLAAAAAARLQSAGGRL